MTEKEKQIQNRADELQNELHLMVKLVVETSKNDPKYKNLSHQDVTNVCFLRMFAELEIKMQDNLEEIKRYATSNSGNLPE